MEGRKEGMMQETFQGQRRQDLGMCCMQTKEGTDETLKKILNKQSAFPVFDTMPSTTEHPKA